MTLALLLCIGSYVALGAIVGAVHGQHQRWLRDGLAERQETYRRKFLTAQVAASYSKDISKEH